MADSDYNEKLISRYESEVRYLKEKLASYERDYTRLEKEQINIAAIAALLHNNHDELNNKLREAVQNFESIIIPNMRGIVHAEKIVSFDDLKNSGSALSKLKSVNDYLMSKYDEIGGEIDTLKGGIGDQVYKINEDIKQYNSKISALKENA